jgi:flagellar hook-associated protein 3 FlgL
MRYQVGVGDNLNINVLGSQLFGSGVKGDMGDLILSFDRFIDSLSRTDQRSYINGQTIAANADNPLNLTNNNVFNIKVDGMAAYTTITIPDPGGYIYDGTPGKTLDDMVAGIQALIDADADLAAANVKVENKDGKITFSANNGRTITISDGPSNNNALEALKIYTDIDKTIVSKTGYEGIKSSITKMEELRDRVMSIRADIGARMNRIELTLNRLENDNINFISLMSKNEEVDMAETIMNLKNEENVYKASLSGGARIIMPTLVDFLR